MDVEKAIRTRRTHKAFAAEEIDPAVLDELIELARWAPNHHLSNPWRFRVLGARPRERAARPGGGGGPRWAPNHHLSNPWRFRVLGARTRERLTELAEAEKPGSAVKLARAPTLIAVSAHLTGEAAQDREDPFATGVAAYLVP